jgi:transposase InsO family protein
MMYPLVRELAVDGIAVAVTCRVLQIARQPYYRWLANPVTDAELTAAHRANALSDAHRDDPEFGYRFLADESRDAGEPMAERTAWKICSELGWWSALGRKRGRNHKKPGPPVHDDLVERDFIASGPNQLWLADITEHWTGGGKLYLCAVKDVYSNRIVGYSIDSRMKSDRGRRARQCRCTTQGRWGRGGRLCDAHRPRVAVQVQEAGPAAQPAPDGRLDGPRRRDRRQRRDSSACCRRTSSTADPGPPARNCASRS